MKIFSKYHLGNIELNNRLVMAPMTRSRASDNIPNSTFRLGDDGQEEATETLKQTIMDHENPALQFWVLDFGEGREVPPALD